MLLTAEEKQTFLSHIREGMSRPDAARAVNPAYSAGMFKRLTNPGTRFYDHEFACEYHDALDTRQRPEHRPRPATLQGFARWQVLTEGQLHDFLELVREGVGAYEATRLLDPPTSLGQIQKLCDNNPDFKNAFQEAASVGEVVYQDLLRAEAKRQAFAGDYRALRDQMIIHLPEAREHLMTTRKEIGIDAEIRVLAERHFPNLPKQMLDELIRQTENEIEANKVIEHKPQLGPGRAA